MQTFLTDGRDFEATARSLDGARLRKQGVECYQILRTLLGESKGWANHPATKMWWGFEPTLLKYTEAIYAEIKSRGWKFDNITNVRALAIAHGVDVKNSLGPVWLDDDRITNTHRSSLYRKAPEHYSQWSGYALVTPANRCCARCNYYWPTHSSNSDYLWS